MPRVNPRRSSSPLLGGSTGRAGPLPNGYVRNWPRIFQRWLGSTTAFPFLLPILRNVPSLWTGRRSWTIFSNIGRLTTVIRMWISIRDGLCGQGSLRKGDTRWLRLTEQWTATAKSVFLFDVQGSVAKSTHTGLPWLRYLRNECRRKIFFWPFDGWDIPPNASVVAEVYPSLWMRRFPRADRDNDQQAAYAVAAWLQRADQDGSLREFLHPPLTDDERKNADIEGWILGVV